ncbi:hypothetical protein FHR92_004182 [Fontibacillus solani]|uniref:Uncharacterized protein n=1 Tax=Fontibacillus solani TaxID=1572857 RepID=A0A7W3SWW0_9BACL|nr:hypothetical protein [Fontibacillus solani]MBA9087697.1 hypothetical protein [Fontibacillus solani]
MGTFIAAAASNTTKSQQSSDSPFRRSLLSRFWSFASCFNRLFARESHPTQGVLFFYVTKQKSLEAADVL